jgi:hypothetical protein
MKPRRIVITIDEIILDAVDAGAQRELGDTLERELRRVFSTAPAAPLRSAELARINGSPITLGPAPRAPGLAAGLAERIHHGVATAGARPIRRP